MFKSVQTKAKINKETKGADRNKEGSKYCGQKQKCRPSLEYGVGVRAGKCGRRGAHREQGREPSGAELHL